MKIRFDEDQVFYGTAIFILPNLFTGILQYFILLCYYLLSEDDLPAIASIGGYCALGLTYLNFNLKIFLICFVRKLDHEPQVFRSKVRQIAVVQGVLLAIGVIGGSVLLGISQHQSNILQECPKFSLFMFLSLYFMAHTCYAVLPY